MLLAVTDTLTGLAGCCREAVRYSSVDTVVALSVALFVNAAILMVAAAAFFNTDGRRPPPIRIAESSLCLGHVERRQRHHV